MKYSAHEKRVACIRLAAQAIKRYSLQIRRNLQPDDPRQAKVLDIYRSAVDITSTAANIR